MVGGQVCRFVLSSFSIFSSYFRWSACHVDRAFSLMTHVCRHMNTDTVCHLTIMLLTEWTRSRDLLRKRTNMQCCEFSTVLRLCRWLGFQRSVAWVSDAFVILDT